MVLEILCCWRFFTSQARLLSSRATRRQAAAFMRRDISRYADVMRMLIAAALYAFSPLPCLRYFPRRDACLSLPLISADR